MPQRNARPATISADAIEAGTKFGWWVVVSPEIIRPELQPGETTHSQPRPAFLMCHCTACGQTTRPVRRAFLLNGRSTSCCLRGPAKAAALAAGVKNAARE
jgi:hypothetical protein